MLHYNFKKWGGAFDALTWALPFQKSNLKWNVPGFCPNPDPGTTHIPVFSNKSKQYMTSAGTPRFWKMKMKRMKPKDFKQNKCVKERL